MHDELIDVIKIAIHIVLIIIDTQYYIFYHISDLFFKYINAHLSPRLMNHEVLHYILKLFEPSICKVIHILLKNL